MGRDGARGRETTTAKADEEVKLWVAVAPLVLLDLPCSLARNPISHPLGNTLMEFTSLFSLARAYDSYENLCVTDFSWGRIHFQWLLQPGLNGCEPGVWNLSSVTFWAHENSLVISVLCKTAT